ATYRYELRMFDGSDPNFTPTMPSHSYLTISEPLSAEKETLNKIKIYPNPTNGTIHISNIENAKLIHIKSILGKHLLTIPATNIIDLSHFPNGIYILQMDNGILRKLIKN
ncbi:T9SS type A sorting domain-containing protein, partial [Flavicella sp.]|uniref:T9SS type A sorting domain-containing protein n=1 Tax=Flavicella sp. TaxID=2957742 RepID=UPI0026211B73